MRGPLCSENGILGYTNKEIEAMSNEMTIQEQADALRIDLQKDLTTEEQESVATVEAAIADLIDEYGEAAKIAVTLAAADFAAE